MGALSRRVTGLILAGGRGRRVGGQDKGLITWNGRTMIAHTIERVAPQVDEIIISCNRNAEIYRQSAPTIVSDRRPDFQGPLAGIEAATAHVHTDYLLVTACDTPLLPEDLVTRLHAGLVSATERTGISIVWDGARDQYLCALIARHVLPSLGKFLDNGGRKVGDWYREQGFVSVDYSTHATAFENVNELQ